MTLIHSATIVPHRVHIPGEPSVVHGISYCIGFRIPLVSKPPQILLCIGLFRLVGRSRMQHHGLILKCGD